MRSTPALIGVIALAAAACASTPSDGTTRGASDVITAEELATIDVADALEAIQRLRPRFLRYRGTTSTRDAGEEGQAAGVTARTGTEIVVYVDGVRMGGVSALESIPATAVHEIRYVNARDATTSYGTGHTGGVIEVVTRRR